MPRTPPGRERVERDVAERVGVLVGPEPLHAIPGSVHSPLTPLAAAPRLRPSGPSTGKKVSARPSTRTPDCRYNIVVHPGGKAQDLCLDPVGAVLRT